MKKRDVSLDMLRGFGIILMVAGHMGWDNFNIYVYSFHMPLFYFLSGYLLKTDASISFSMLALQRFKRLMIPYYLFGIVHYFIYLIVKGFQTGDAGELLLNLALFPTQGLPVAGALWFLPSLFVAELLLYLFMKCFKKNWMQMIAMAVILLLGFYINYLKWKLPLGMETSTVAVLFCYVGYLFKKYETMNFIMNRKIIFSTGLITLFLPCNCLCYKNGLVGMFFGDYHNEFIFLFCAFYGILFWWFMTKLVCNFWSRLCVGRIIIYAGMNSLVFLAFNQLFLFFYRKFLVVVLKKEWFGSDAVHYQVVNTTAFCLVILSLFGVIWITNKWKISRVWRS